MAVKRYDIAIAPEGTAPMVLAPAGVSGNADVVTASLGLNAARTLVIDALTAWHVARISLARAQGDARSLR